MGPKNNVAHNITILRNEYPSNNKNHQTSVNECVRKLSGNSSSSPPPLPPACRENQNMATLSKGLPYVPE
jgi:hypothetical protein